MQVRPHIEEPDLDKGTPAASCVPGMEWLVEVLKEMNEESERFLLLGPRGSWVGQHPLEILDLADYTPLGRAEPGIVARFRDRHVDVVPWAAPLYFTLFVGLGGGIGESLARLQDVSDGGERRRAQPGLGHHHGRAVARSAPRLAGSWDQQQSDAYPRADSMPTAYPASHGLAGYSRDSE